MLGGSGHTGLQAERMERVLSEELGGQCGWSRGDSGGGCKEKRLLPAAPDVGPREPWNARSLGSTRRTTRSRGGCERGAKRYGVQGQMCCVKPAADEDRNGRGRLVRRLVWGSRLNRTTA